MNFCCVVLPVTDRVFLKNSHWSKNFFYLQWLPWIKILITALWKRTAPSIGRISIASVEGVCSGSHPLRHPPQYAAQCRFLPEGNFLWEYQVYPSPDPCSRWKNRHYSRPCKRTPPRSLWERELPGRSSKLMSTRPSHRFLELMATQWGAGWWRATFVRMCLWVICVSGFIWIYIV